MPRDKTAATTASATVDVDALLESTGLRYARDGEPGIRRQGAARAFTYIDAHGHRISDERELARIARLAVPPAWTNVWICRDSRGHLQATGRDARGRKQYRYHAHWREERDSDKFHRLAAFGKSLPALRAAVERDLALPALPRRKVLAAMVGLLATTFVRVGDERYRRENHTYGLTTLRNRHVEVSGDRIRLRFRGKAGKEHDLLLSDKRLARVVRRCRDLPGYELFQYVDSDGEVRSIGAADVNEYLRGICGADYTAKDFRTWGATVIVADTLMDASAPASEREAVRTVNDALRQAADVLGNTVAVCRKSYVHPGVIDTYRDSTQTRVVRAAARKGLRAREWRVLGLLERLVRAAKRETHKSQRDLAETLSASIARNRSETHSRGATRSSSARIRRSPQTAAQRFATRKHAEAHG